MPRLSRSLLSVFLVVALFQSAAIGAPARAAEAGSSAVPDQALQSPDGKFIQDLGDRAIKIISNKQLSSEQRNAEFSAILNDAFDLRTIGRFVIGRAWKTATPEQQSEYMDLFKALVIKNYGDRMTLATGENFQVVGLRPESEEDAVVSSQITHPDGSKPTTIDWRVRQKNGKMGVIDVIVEGVSLSVTQRQEYASVIQNNDGQIDGLLKVMRDQLKGAQTSASGAP
ncbi:MAG: ABC transporter substrate-binding protein [Alphaproteobacteria bacterium]|nr:ABC transporter substrate-binding protein [Alphaproteobacteria bacterium]